MRPNLILPISSPYSNRLDDADDWEESKTIHNLEPVTQAPQTATWNEEQRRLPPTRVPGRPPSETVSEAQLRIVGERVVFK